MFFKYKNTIVNLKEVQSIEESIANQIRITFKNGAVVLLEPKTKEINNLIETMYNLLTESN